VSTWLTCVIPTIGRPTLARTLDSLDAQSDCADLEVIVVADTFGGITADLEVARDHVREERDPARYLWLEHDAGLHCAGQPQRTLGGHAASAPWVWFTQDDNIAAPDALRVIRRAVIAQAHPRPLFFRWLSPWREVIWRQPYLTLGNIDADCLVLPRHITRLVDWGLRYEGDYDAAYRAWQIADGDVGWIDQVISIARPDPAHYWWQHQTAEVTA
jgi:hypothetical protein